jgi:putative membrane protein
MMTIVLFLPLLLFQYPIAELAQKVLSKPIGLCPPRSLEKREMTTTPTPRTANELAQDRTDLAATRTLMAADRTLMAWVRTALSLEGFGFTIYKVLQAFAEEGRALPREQTPRNVGLFLTAMGVLAMVMGTVEYLQTRKALQPIQEVPLARPSFLMALLMSVMGVLLFFGIITRVL